MHQAAGRPITPARVARYRSSTILADETWFGGDPKRRHQRPEEPVRIKPGNKRPYVQTDKTPILSLINRTTGEVRSRVVPDVTGATLRKAIAEQVDMGGSVLHTDSLNSYITLGREFLRHEAVNHTDGAYVRGDVTTNHVESYFSQLKRSLDGTHHHVSSEHLNRYLAEFDYRYSTRKMDDTHWLQSLMSRTGGRRLSYKRITAA
jgi:transposase-like protein